MNKLQEATQEMINLFKEIRITRKLHENYPSINDPTGHYDEEININGNLYHIECDITENDVKHFFDKKFADRSCYA